ncbi:MAG: PEP-CTERM sorting domain-containing protein [Caldimonas sp.]
MPLRLRTPSGSESRAGPGLDNGVITGQTVSAVPEPATFGLMSLGLAVIGFARRKRIVI